MRFKFDRRQILRLYNICVKNNVAIITKKAHGDKKNSAPKYEKYVPLTGKIKYTVYIIWDGKVIVYHFLPNIAYYYQLFSEKVKELLYSNSKKYDRSSLS